MVQWCLVLDVFIGLGSHTVTLALKGSWVEVPCCEKWDARFSSGSKSVAVSFECHWPSETSFNPASASDLVNNVGHE